MCLSKARQRHLCSWRFPIDLRRARRLHDVDFMEKHVGPNLEWRVLQAVSEVYRYYLGYSPEKELLRGKRPQLTSDLAFVCDSIINLQDLWDIWRWVFHSYVMTTMHNSLLLEVECEYEALSLAISFWESHLAQ